MRLVFCGTPQFAVPALDALRQAGHTVELVLAQPDRPRGRGMEVQYSPVKKFALEHAVDLEQPEKIRNKRCPAGSTAADRPGRDHYRRLWTIDSAVDARAAALWKFEFACVAAAEISRGGSHSMGHCQRRSGDRGHHHTDRRGARYRRHSAGRTCTDFAEPDFR